MFIGLIGYLFMLLVVSVMLGVDSVEDLVCLLCELFGCMSYVLVGEGMVLYFVVELFCL